MVQLFLTLLKFRVNTGNKLSLLGLTFIVKHVAKCWTECSQFFSIAFSHVH